MNVKLPRRRISILLANDALLSLQPYAQAPLLHPVRLYLLVLHRRWHALRVHSTYLNRSRQTSIVVIVGHCKIRYVPAQYDGQCRWRLCHGDGVSMGRWVLGGVESEDLVESRILARLRRRFGLTRRMTVVRRPSGLKSTKRTSRKGRVPAS